MPSRFRIKVGAVELEFEGPEEFLKENLADLLSAVPKLAQTVPSSALQLPKPQPEGPPDEKEEGQPLKMTTANIAARLNSKTGSDLALAAAAHLTLVKGDKVMSYKAILDEMRTATHYYKKSYSNNLSKYLATLVKEDKLNEPSKSQYALTAPAKAELANEIGS